jgi:HK97 family phage major capsid protein
MARSRIALAMVALLAVFFIAVFGGSADAAFLYHAPSLTDTAMAMTMVIPGLPQQSRRGILAVHANAGVLAAVEQVSASFNEFKQKYNSRLDGIEATLDQNSAIAAAALVGAGSLANPVDPEYSGFFAGWARNGRDEHQLRELNAQGMRSTIQASMSAGTDSAGGYLAPVEWDRQVLNALKVVSPMRRLATVITTSVRAYSTIWSNKTWGSGWVGETASRPETGTPTLSPVPFGHGEIYANPAITQQLLDDADFPLEQWLATELADEFTTQESTAFIAGNGTNKPNGLLTYATGAANAAAHPGGAVSVMTAAAAAAFSSDELVTFVYSLPAPYRQNAVWLMNSLTAAKIMMMKDGNDNYIWQRNLAAGQPSTLLGYPVEIDENMPDIAAGAIPIAFGDFKRGYVINDRTGVRILRDPYTNKPYVNFYATKRVGGGLRDPRAFRFLKMAAA